MPTPALLSSASAPYSALPEYVYICQTDDAVLAPYLKIGKTVRTPKERAKEFPGVDARVQWSAVREFETPDCHYTETLVHRRLDTLCQRFAPRRELFAIDEATAVAVIEHCLTLTPVPLRASRLPATFQHCDVLVESPETGELMPDPIWRHFLGQPVSAKRLGTPRLPLSAVLAAAVTDNWANGALTILEKRGIQLIRYDLARPRFRLYTDSNSAFTEWLKRHGLAWEDLGGVEGGTLDFYVTIRAK